MVTGAVAGFPGADLTEGVPYVINLTHQISDYIDAFNAGPLGTVIFRRDSTGRATELHVVQDRVWDLRFSKVKS